MSSEIQVLWLCKQLDRCTNKERPGTHGEYTDTAACRGVPLDPEPVDAGEAQPRPLKLLKFILPGAYPSAVRYDTCAETERERADAATEARTPAPPHFRGGDTLFPTYRP